MDGTYGGDAVGVATVGDGSGLWAVGGVVGHGLSDGLGGDSASGEGKGSKRETHVGDI